MGARLCALCYEITTLKHAFDARSLNGLAQKTIKGNYDRMPTQLNDGDDVVDACDCPLEW